MAESSSSPAPVTGADNDNDSVSSLSRLGGSSSDSCCERADRGNHQAETNHPTPRSEGVAEADTGLERTEMHQSARNRQHHVAVLTPPIGINSSMYVQKQKKKPAKTASKTTPLAGCPDPIHHLPRL